MFYFSNALVLGGRNGKWHIFFVVFRVYVNSFPVYVRLAFKKIKHMSSCDLFIIIYLFFLMNFAPVTYKGETLQADAIVFKCSGFGS